MKNFLRKLATLATIALTLPAAATSFSPDYTDLWINPAEAGWGVNVIQQDDVLFATFFLFGADGSARWYSASDTRAVSSPSGQNVFSGTLFQSAGTYFGAPWAGVSTNPVGTVSFAFTSPTVGAISYTINGVSVTKVISRFTFVAEDMGGRYFGGMSVTASNCNSAALNGQARIIGELVVSHTVATQPSLRIDFTNASGTASRCTFTGAYGQDGRLGKITGGQWICVSSSGVTTNSGTYTMSQIQTGTNGLNARLFATDQFCTYDGYFGGLRDVP